MFQKTDVPVLFALCLRHSPFSFVTVQMYPPILARLRVVCPCFEGKAGLLFVRVAFCGAQSFVVET